MSISFSEIILVGVIALVTIKPEQLPEMARKLGQFVGGARRTVSKFSDEVNKITKEPDRE